MLIYTKSVEEELCDWLRDVPRSVSVAKTFRNEGEDDSKSSEGDITDENKVSENDPWSKIDFDNLPDETREHLTKIKDSFASLQKDTTTLKTEKENAVKLASQFQSKADKALAKLQQHNLSVDDGSGGIRHQAENLVEKELEETYLKAGFNPEVAKAYAKMNALTTGVLEKHVITKVGHAVAPHLQNVGHIASERMVDEAERTEAFGDYLSDPEINTEVRESLSQMVKSGAELNQQTLEVVIGSIVGQHLMKGNLNVNRQNQQQQQRQVVQGGRFNSSVHGGTRQTVTPRNGAPQAANDETKRAADILFQHMKQGLKLKK